MAMTVVATYDVVDDKRRIRLAALLQAYGERIQKSVFIVTVTAEQLDDITRKAERIINRDTDSLWLLRQCETCWDKARKVGQASLPPKVMLWSVM